MHRRLILLLIVPLFSGCSWLNEFMLFNKSKRNVVVYFRYGSVYTSNAIVPPKVYAITGWNNDLPLLGDTIHVYSRLDGDSLWYVELPSSSALVLAEDLNQNFHNEEQCKNFLTGLQVLRVLSSNDAVFTCNDTACFRDVVVLSQARAGLVIDN